MRKVLVYLNSPNEITIEDNVKTWGQLKSLLVTKYGYNDNVIGFLPDLGETIDTPEYELPMNDFTINLIVQKSKYGNK